MSDPSGSDTAPTNEEPRSEAPTRATNPELEARSVDGDAGASGGEASEAETKPVAKAKRPRVPKTTKRAAAPKRAKRTRKAKVVAEPDPAAPASVEAEAPQGAEAEELDSEFSELEQEEDAVDEAMDETVSTRRLDDRLDPSERAALEDASASLDEDEEEDPDPEDPEAMASAAIERKRLDQDAVKVIRRLKKHNFEAYLVGGCVRDLLAGLEPKDFDVATSAKPEEVKAIFSNCRLIGRRFRLAHVYFHGGKVIETATFRSNPRGEQAGAAELPAGDLYIEQDNVWGSAEEDARRRDLTINGLFYDPTSGKVIDHVDGLADLQARRVRTIGDPKVRLAEDPVRILRAVRFAAKMDFEFDPETFEAMKLNAPGIARCSSPRVLEEVLRLLRGGSSRGAFVLLDQIGALELLLPPIAKILGDGADPEKAARMLAYLDAFDERIHEKGSPPPDALALAVLLAPLFEPDELPGPRSVELDTLIAELVKDARLPKRTVERLRLILGAQRIFEGEKRRRFSVSRFVQQAYAHEALELLRIRVHATGEGRDSLGLWTKRISGAGSGRQDSKEGRGSGGGRKRKRSGRRGGRGGRGGRGRSSGRSGGSN